jgi:hypothetical protein
MSDASTRHDGAWTSHETATTHTHDERYRHPGTDHGDGHPDEIRHDRNPGDPTARDRFGGINWGAAVFGWLVAIALTVLLAGITGAVAAGAGESLDLTLGDAEREAGTLGLAAGITLLVVLMIGYFAGGYVSGRMSRFDGARQGLGVWVVGLVVTLLVALTGWIFGSEYDIFERVDLPSVPLSDDAMTVGGIVLAAAVVLGALLAAVIGGRLGLRYHHKVDRHDRRDRHTA